MINTRISMIGFLILFTAVSQAALIHHWKLDETLTWYSAGSVWSGVIDSVSGVPTGVLWCYGEADAVNTNVTGQPGVPLYPGDKSYNFTEPTGISGVNTNTMTAIPTTGDFTLLVWMKTDNLHAVQGHLFSNNNGQVGRANLHVLNGALMWFQNGGVTLTENNAPIFDNKWHEVGVSRKGNQFFLLRDGLVVGSAAVSSGTAPISTNQHWMIGRQRSFAGDFDGFIADVKIYDTDFTNITDRAHQPAPANSAIAVATDVKLQWTKAENPEVTAHYLYLTPGEPNFVGKTPVTIAVNQPAEYQTSLEMDKTYYWRVDQAVNGSSASDPNTVRGFVWSFETIKSVPVIVQEPDSVVVEVHQTASFTCDVSSLSNAYYTWYKSVDGISFSVFSGPTLSGHTLTIPNVQLADQGFFYCSVVNDSGPENAVTSRIVSLGVKQLMAHWTLDAADYQGGKYLDKTGQYHAEPNGVPTFVEGIAGDAVQVDPFGWANAGAWRPNAYTGQMTVSAWIKITGSITGDSQGIVSKRNAAGMDWSFYVRGGDAGHAGNNWVRFSSFAGGDVWAGPNAVIAGEWVHVAAVVDASNAGRIYLNGRLAQTDTTWSYGVNPNAPILLGKGAPDGLLLPGQLDEVRIYNYGLNAEQVAALYANISGKPVCLYPPDSRFDISGPEGKPDCIVDLYDFAALSAQWLESGLIHPQP